ARGLLLFAEPVDVRLALLQRQRKRDPGRRRFEHAQPLAGALAAQAVDFLLDPLAGLAPLAHVALALGHHPARLLGAVRAQLDRLLERIAPARCPAHANSFPSICDERANGTSSSEDCCSSCRIGPMRSIA